MTGFEIPPRTPQERDRRLADLEASVEQRELDVAEADRNLERWPAMAWALYEGRPR